MFISYRNSDAYTCTCTSICSCDNSISSAYLWQNEDDMLNYHGYVLCEKLALNLQSGDFWVSSQNLNMFRNTIKLYFIGYTNQRIDLRNFTSVSKIEVLDVCKLNFKNVKQPILHLISPHIPTDICKLDWTARSCVMQNKLIFTSQGIKHDILVRTSGLLAE